MRLKYAFAFAIILACTQTVLAYEGTTVSMAEKLKIIESISANAVKTLDWFNKCTSVVQLEESMVLDTSFMTELIVKSGIRTDISQALRICESPRSQTSYFQFTEGTQTSIPNPYEQLTVSLKRIQADARRLVRVLR